MATEACPCKFCGQQTRMLGTEMCDGCWEVHHRLTGMDDALAAKIVGDARPELMTVAYQVDRFFDVEHAGEDEQEMFATCDWLERTVLEKIDAMRSEDPTEDEEDEDAVDA